MFERLLTILWRDYCQCHVIYQRMESNIRVSGDPFDKC